MRDTLLENCFGYRLGDMASKDIIHMNLNYQSISLVIGDPFPRFTASQS